MYSIIYSFQCFKNPSKSAGATDWIENWPVHVYRLVWPRVHCSLVEPYWTGWTEVELWLVQSVFIFYIFFLLFKYYLYIWHPVQPWLNQLNHDVEVSRVQLPACFHKLIHFRVHFAINSTCCIIWSQTSINTLYIYCEYDLSHHTLWFLLNSV